MAQPPVSHEPVGKSSPCPFSGKLLLGRERIIPIKETDIIVEVEEDDDEDT